MTHRYEYPRPALTVDTVVFSIEDHLLQVLLIERAEPPFAGSWALPGGFVEVCDDGGQGESVDQAAWRELEEEAGIPPAAVRLEQFHTFGQPGRDPRGRTVTVAYCALVHCEVPFRGGSDARRAKWFSLDALPTLAFDHQQIVAAALTWIRDRLDAEPRIASCLMPAEFAEAEFRQVAAVIRGASNDEDGFSRRFERMLEDGKLEPAPGGSPQRGQAAQLYRIAPAAADLNASN